MPLSFELIHLSIRSFKDGPCLWGQISIDIFTNWEFGFNLSGLTLDCSCGCGHGSVFIVDLGVGRVSVTVRVMMHVRSIFRYTCLDRASDLLNSWFLWWVSLKMFKKNIWMSLITDLRMFL